MILLHMLICSTVKIHGSAGPQTRLFCGHHGLWSGNAQLVLDLKDLNVDFTTDHILGLLLQLNLQDGPVKSKFAQ